MTTVAAIYTVGAGLFAAGTAASVAAGVAAVAVAAAGAAVAANALMDSMAPDMGGAQLGVDSSATPIDKSMMQAEAKAAELKLGEEEKKKKDRKKGKAAFKIELDKANEPKETATGVQIAAPAPEAPKASGVQL